MRKKIFLRAILGLPLGLAIGYVMSIITSLARGDGYYSPCEPELAAAMGNEINAVLLQAFLCGILGMGFSAGAVIWEMEHWSIAKQTGLYFLIEFLIMMPIAYVTYWMEHSLKGFLGYFGIFVLIFAVVWIVQYAIVRRSIKKMNENLGKL